MISIYHITHLQNLPSIVANGGLACDSVASAAGLASVSIAHAHIKQRRARRVVPLPPGGMLSEYVPFYFAPRSPMLFAIHGGFVAGYNHDQTDVLHLVCDAEAIVAAGLPYLYTDGHAEMAISAFFSDLRDLDKIDWQIMDERYWNDTQKDGDRTRRRQAEFLVHHFVPWSFVTDIGVINPGVAQKVNRVLQGATQPPSVVVHRDWYY